MKQTLRRIVLLVIASLVMAFNLNTFVKAAELIPGGFTGCSLLIRELLRRATGVELPFSLVYYVVNALPVYIGFRYIGKWFTVFSCLTVVLTGLGTDLMPGGLVGILGLEDHLLAALFGGILNGAAISLCLNAGATSGGTDFIAIYMAEKRGTDAWMPIFAANCVLFGAAALLWTPVASLYSILFQWVTTTTTTALYKGYQQKTLFIVTAKPDDVYQIIRETTHHDATAFTGIGEYQKTARVMLYSVVSATDVHPLVAAIKNADPAAFINVIKTEELTGRFYRRPKD